MVDDFLASYTTLRLGGPAGRLVVADTDEVAVEAVRAAAGERVLVLAGGSNVVVADVGFPGTVVLLRQRGIDVSEEDGRVAVTVAAGEPWDEVVSAAVAAGWAGIESLSGIPGSAGATPIQNVGAYGQEVAETITEVRAYDRDAGEIVTLAAKDCGFAYRTSVFKHDDRFVVLSVSFALAASKLSTPVRYEELARALGVVPGERAPLEDLRAAVLALRRGKGMVLDPEDHDTWSVGSFFTNPVVSEQFYREMAPQPPGWPNPDGTVKVSAAWLIQHAGFAKGYSTNPRVGISTKHTLALTNRGGGTTEELLDLAREVRDGVRERFKITLHPEPVLVNTAL